MKYQISQNYFRPTCQFLKKHDEKVNCILIFSPLVLVILTLLYVILHPQPNMFFFYCSSLSLIVTLCGLVKEHYGDIREGKKFRDNMSKVDGIKEIFRKHEQILDEQNALIERLNTERQKRLNALIIELSQKRPASRD